MSNNDDLAELVAIVGAGNVGGLDKFLAPAADAFHAVLKGVADKCHDVKEEETACHDAASSQRILGGFLALFLNVFDTSARAIVVVVELVECTEITTEAQGETFCICDEVLEASRLSSSVCFIWGRSDRLFSTAIFTWGVHEARDVVAVRVGIPARCRGRHLYPLSVARHTNLIQGSDVASTLWKTIRGHEAMVTALQGDL